MEKINTVRQIIERIVKKRGYTLEERKSTSSNSWYFKIYSGDQSLMFRISDHKTKSDVITLRLDKVRSLHSIEGFVENRCKDLSDRRIKALLHM